MDTYDRLKPRYAPIREKVPNPKEKAQNLRLEEYMKTRFAVESDEEIKHKTDVLNEILTIFKRWVKDVAISERGMPEEEASEVGGKLLLAGSFKINIREPGADIDTVCGESIIFMMKHI
jgi:poly(A) polymerase